jgi:hypothetical protein
MKPIIVNHKKRRAWALLILPISVRSLNTLIDMFQDERRTKKIVIGAGSSKLLKQERGEKDDQKNATTKKRSNRISSHLISSPLLYIFTLNQSQIRGFAD